MTDSFQQAGKSVILLLFLPYSFELKAQNVLPSPGGGLLKCATLSWRSVKTNVPTLSVHLKSEMGIQSPTLCYLSWQEGAETTDSLVQVRWIPRLPWNCLESPNFLGFNLCAFDQILNKRQIAEKVDISIPSLLGLHVIHGIWYMVTVNNYSLPVFPKLANRF